MKAKKTTLIVLIAAAALFIGACGPMIASAAGSDSPAAQTTTDQPRTLNASGSGMVSLSPDVAYVTIGVHSQDLDAKTAVDKNSQQTQDLIAALKAFGVAEADIQTTNFNIYSFQDYSQPVAPESNGNVPLTYSVDNSVYVTVRNIGTIGDLLSTAVEAGANNIWGIQFDVLDKSEALSQAREMAVEAAKAQADELATLAGVELVEIVNISSYGGGYPQPYYASGLGGGGAAETAAISVPVTPGQISVSVDVNIVYSIR